MTSILDLDDPNKGSVYIPPQDDVQDLETSTSTPTLRDIPGGQELRLEIFKNIWEKYTHRVNSVLRELYAPVVTSVLSHIYQSHTPEQSLPGIPYPELPVVSLSAPGGGAQILANILDAFKPAQKESRTRGGRIKGKGRMVEPESDELKPSVRVAHLHPADCVNLTAAMKAIITGFVDTHPMEDDESDEDDLVPKATKRKPSTSLANYDINLLRAWYLSLEDPLGEKMRLVVVVHDFEQLDANVMQDVFYICSQYVSDIPFVFLLITTSPTSSSVLYNTYPRSTLSLMCISTVSAPSGPTIIEQILAKLFFSTDYEPEVMIGPATLEFLADFCIRHTSSVDASLDVLQLALMKHFQEPFTVFVKDALLGTKTLAQSTKMLQRPESFDFLDSLLTRLWAFHSSVESPFSDLNVDWRSPSVSSLLSCVSLAHTIAQERSQNLRLGLSVMRLVTRYMQAQGYRVSGIVDGKDGYGLDLMCNIIRGRFSKDLKYLALMVKKLSGRQLDALLTELHDLFQSLPPPQFLQEENARTQIARTKQQLPDEAVETEDHNDEVGIHPAVPPLATSLAEWFIEYIESKASKLDQGPLWDVWNTGMNPFPSELLNPAPRITMVNALLHPHVFQAMHKGLFESNEVGPATDPSSRTVVSPSTPGRRELIPEIQRQPPLWELPDSSILFRRYMEAGKMINVYDWYESFAVALETQRREQRKASRIQNTNGVNGVSHTPQTPRTPRTPKRGRKGKEKAVEEVIEDIAEEVEEEMDEDELEEWRIEVQARFMRAYHDLDFMGFIKHTGRKADHVIKTIYDLPD